jgi:hypothetical protein
MTATTTPASATQAQSVSLTTALLARIAEHSSAAAAHGGDVAKEELDGIRRTVRRLAARRMSAEAEAINVDVIGRLALGALSDVDEQGRVLLDKIALDTVKLGGLLRLRRELAAYGA